MDLNEIIKNIPVWASMGGVGVILAGLAVHTGIKIYKNEKRTRAHFQELRNNYRDDFSKEELMQFYGDLLDTRKHLILKRRETADRMCANLEEQIMVYATQEVQDAIANGAVLSFEDPITQYSETYRKAIGLSDSEFDD